MNKTRPNRVYFRVTDTELELINECVKTSGMTRQDWILSVVTPQLNGGDTKNEEVVTSLTDPQADNETPNTSKPTAKRPIPLRILHRASTW